jgi:hypothetical protein
MKLKHVLYLACIGLFLLLAGAAMDQTHCKALLRVIGAQLESMGINDILRALSA